MSYSKTFNAAWAKPKKGQVKKQAEVSVNVKPVEVPVDLSNPATTDVVATQPEQVLSATAPTVESQETREASTEDPAVSLEAAGIRTIDFAYVASQIPSQSRLHQHIGADISFSHASENASEASTTADADATESQAAPESTDTSAGYSKRFSKQWSQPNRPSPEPSQNLGTVTTSYLPICNPQLADNHGTSGVKLRHSASYRRRSKDDADLTSSLDGQTVRLLREQFSADEFLAYYRGRRSRENTPAARRYDQPLMKPRDPTSVRDSRTSSSSIGDTPPRYHRVSRGSENSDRGRRSSSNNNPW